MSISAYGQAITSFKIIDAVSGEEVPCQRIKAVPTNETDETVTLTFIAENVPSMGYRTYYLVPFQEEIKGGRDRNNQIPLKPTLPSAIDASSNSDTYENQFYKISFGKGGLKSIYDKQLQKELLQTDKFLGGKFFSWNR